MIAFPRKVHVCIINSPALEDLMLADCPIRFFPEEQYSAKKNELGNKECIFSDIPEGVIGYLTGVEDQLEKHDMYEVRDSVTSDFIIGRIKGKVTRNYKEFNRLFIEYAEQKAKSS